MVNTVLATITANTFKEFSDAIESGKTPKEVAQEALKDSFKAIFNGNGYDVECQEKLTKAGAWRIDSGVEAMCRITAEKNVKLFEDLKILTSEECSARQSVMLNHYSGTVEIEANCMIDMIQQYIIPAVKTANVGSLVDLQEGVNTLKNALADIHHTSDEKEKAKKARVLRLETMIQVRRVCDDVEAVVPAHLWTLATYKDLLFLDQQLA